MYRSLLRTPTQPLLRENSRNSTERTQSALNSDTSACSTVMPPLNTPVTVLDHSPRFSNYINGDEMPSQNFVHNHQRTPAEATVIKLRDARRRFAKGTPADEDAICAPTDRQLVLNVYNEALCTLSDVPEKHLQIEAECNRKIRVILGIVSADPDDPVFTPNGQLLKPLEPQYANPRLSHSGDPYGRLAHWRLSAWREDGWPARYPAEAVGAEKKRGQQLVNVEGTQKMKDRAMLNKVIEDSDMWKDDSVGYGGDPSDKETALEWTRVRSKGKEKSKASARLRVETTYKAPSTRKHQRRDRNGDDEKEIEDLEYEN
jgi:hypothetical protein